MEPTTSSSPSPPQDTDIDAEPMAHENGTSIPKMKEKSLRLFNHWPFDFYAVYALARLLPPYTRLAVLVFCGMELLWSIFIMILNQKFYEYSTKIFPIAYSMFIYTESKDKNDSFAWTKNDLHELTMYQHKLMYLWFISTIIVIYCVLCMILQFFTFETRNSGKQTMCMQKPRMGYIMAPILFVLMLISFGLLLCEYWTFGAYYDLFQTLFSNSLQEEKFLGEIEKNLDCVLDEDEENTGAWLCVTAIQRALLNPKWLTWILRIYVVWHVLMAILAIFFNKKIRMFKKKDEKDDTNIEHDPKEPLLI